MACFAVLGGIHGRCRWFKINCKHRIVIIHHLTSLICLKRFNCCFFCCSKFPHLLPQTKTFPTLLLFLGRRKNSGSLFFFSRPQILPCSCPESIPSSSPLSSHLYSDGRRSSRCSEYKGVSCPFSPIRCVACCFFKIKSGETQSNTSLGRVVRLKRSSSVLLSQECEIVQGYCCESSHLLCSLLKTIFQEAGQWGERMQQ